MRGDDQAFSANQLVSSTDVQVFSVVRSALAVASLVLIWLDPSEPKRWVELTYASLAAYALYSLGIAYAAHQQQWLRPARLLYWADVLFAGYLIGLTEGTLSAYFFFFFFSIMAAAFTGGFREGLLVTFACTAVFLVATVFVTPHALTVDFDRALIRPVWLIGLGLLISYWGGFEITLKRRLALLSELTGSYHPRVDRDGMIAMSVRRLCSVYGADSCILAARGESPRAGSFFRCGKEDAHRLNGGDEIPEPSLRQLLSLKDAVGKYSRRRFQRVRSSTEPRSTASTEDDFLSRAKDDNNAEAVANLLEAESFLTVPYSQPGGTQGRLFLVWKTQRWFDNSDVQFLIQWSAALATTVGNLVMHEQIVNEAAELERLITSRDLHDEVVQPYVALQLALQGLSREIPPETPGAHRLRDVLEMTESTVSDIRKVAVDPRTGSASTTTSLRRALKLHVERYRRYFGIDVEVSCPDAPRLPRGLALAAFRIVSEALSNILRHTSSRRVLVSLRLDEPNIELEIRNELAAGQPPLLFTPRSISERVQERGGKLTVLPDENGYTVIRAKLPLTAPDPIS